MDSHETLGPSESAMPVRTLKIEQHGDYFKGRIKPKIRLIGQWLERAGFKPGSRLLVSCPVPGVLELRSIGHPPDQEKQALPEHSKWPF